MYSLMTGWSLPYWLRSAVEFIRYETRKQEVRDEFHVRKVLVYYSSDMWTSSASMLMISTHRRLPRFKNRWGKGL